MDVVIIVFSIVTVCLSVCKIRMGYSQEGKIIYILNLIHSIAKFEMNKLLKDKKKSMFNKILSIKESFTGITVLYQKAFKN